MNECESKVLCYLLLRKNERGLLLKIIIMENIRVILIYGLWFQF